MEGIELLSVDDFKFPTKFIFENSSDNISKFVNLWERAKAEGNLFQFYRSYKTMISKVKDKNGGTSGKAR